MLQVLLLTLISNIVRLLHYDILQTPSHLNFINESKIEPDKINDTKAGEMFYNWISQDRKSKTRIIPDFDVALLFTGLLFYLLLCYG